MIRLTSIAAAVFTAAFLAATAPTPVAADSNIDQVTYLTFSGPVQMPGVTLPAGKYVFRYADTALHNIIQVLDGEQRQILGQWFFVPRNRTTEEMSAANGKPVVTFHESAAGVTPAIQFYFYPTDLAGKEFIYPKDQALRIAAGGNGTVLATDSDVASGGAPNVYEVGASASAETAAASAETAPVADQAESTASAAAAAEPAPAAEAVATDRGTDLSADRDQAVGTSGEQVPAATDSDTTPRQQASNELPQTASPFQLIGFLGLMSLAGGFGLRLARSTN
jgi:pyruvate/2-oxoglutarate dehydrogenase complex dihydrolipoamide acyltransferase (E2) component